LCAQIPFTSRADHSNCDRSRSISRISIDLSREDPHGCYRNAQIKNVVFLMLENCSLDNVLGWLYRGRIRPAQATPDQPLNALFEGVGAMATRSILVTCNDLAALVAAVAAYRRDPEGFEATLTPTSS
jgi:hypothetical protein